MRRSLEAEKILNTKHAHTLRRKILGQRLPRPKPAWKLFLEKVFSPKNMPPKYTANPDGKIYPYKKFRPNVKLMQSILALEWQDGKTLLEYLGKIIRRNINQNSPIRFLDLGGGEGTYSLLLKENLARELAQGVSAPSVLATNLDLNLEEAEKAKAANGNTMTTNSVSGVQGNFFEVLPFADRIFDLVFTKDALPHFKSLDSIQLFLIDVLRILRLGGIFVLVYHPGQSAPDQGKFSATDIEKIVKQVGFREVRSCSFIPEQDDWYLNRWRLVLTAVKKEKTAIE